VKLEIMNPKVSWLICTNNYDSLLCRAIDSCLNQTYDDFELILVVNGSSRDNIQKNINLKYASDSRVTVLSTPINLLNFSLNFGLNFARGKYVARMDADDIAYPDRLKEQVKYLDSNPGVIVVCSSFDFCYD
jgi:glycosyltransferase involved in cell wall biosynthesis